MMFPLYRLSRLLIHVPTWNRSEKRGGRVRFHENTLLIVIIALIITRGAFAAIDGPGMMIEAGLNNEPVEAI